MRRREGVEMDRGKKRRGKGGREVSFKLEYIVTWTCVWVHYVLYHYKHLSVQFSSSSMIFLRCKRQYHIH